MLDKENAKKCDRTYRNMRHTCKFLHMWYNFCMCSFEKAIICGKICDIRVWAKYAIAYSHITSIPNLIYALK